MQRNNNENNLINSIYLSCTSLTSAEENENTLLYRLTLPVADVNRHINQAHGANDVNHSGILLEQIRNDINGLPINNIVISMSQQGNNYQVNLHVSKTIPNDNMSSLIDHLETQTRQNMEGFDEESEEENDVEIENLDNEEKNYNDINYDTDSVMTDDSNHSNETFMTDIIVDNALDNFKFPESIPHHDSRFSIFNSANNNDADTTNDVQLNMN